MRGSRDIIDVDNCATRLRMEIADPSGCRRRRDRRGCCCRAAAGFVAHRNRGCRSGLKPPASS
ncbi:PTS transporter subunit EIIB, partial [Microbacterium laevaniformans]